MAVLEQTDAIRPVPASELEARLEKFRRLMDEMHPGWEMAAVNHKIAMYWSNLIRICRLPTPDGTSLIPKYPHAPGWFLRQQ